MDTDLWTSELRAEYASYEAQLEELLREENAILDVVPINEDNLFTDVRRTLQTNTISDGPVKMTFFQRRPKHNRASGGNITDIIIKTNFKPVRTEDGRLSLIGSIGNLSNCIKQFLTLMKNVYKQE